MPDRISQETRSKIMSHIRSKDTAIELKVRKYLFSKGFRYEGKPDLVLPKYKTVIFIHGCFWHGHSNCKIAHMPKSNNEYWDKKLRRNIENDKKHRDVLESMGWRVIVIWECELNNDFEGTMLFILNKLHEGKI